MTIPLTMQKNKGSFRDPAGFIFTENKRVFRAINVCYKAEFEHFIGSGLSAALVREGLIVGFKDAPKTTLADDASVYKIIEPDFIPFISYPYEWSFSMLQSAALLTLKIQQIALAHGMSLKDASSYNVQFLNGKAIFIDTLSFEFYTLGETWVAYRQFCQHFIAPLSLMAAIKPELVRLLSIYIDGVPLDVAWAMLPFGAKWNLGYYMHLNLHAKAQAKHRSLRKKPSVFYCIIWKKQCHKSRCLTQKVNGAIIRTKPYTLRIIPQQKRELYRRG
jgi:hypothetical protein